MVELKILSLQEIEYMHRTYMHEAFPDNELRPYAHMEQLYLQGNYVCYGLFDDGSLRGYAFFSKSNASEDLLLDYFAMLPEYRSHGYGAVFFREIQKYLPHQAAVLIEVENPASAPTEAEFQLRTRRIGFYERNGCQQTMVSSLLFHVDFMILQFSPQNTLSTEEVYTTLNQIYHTMFTDDVYEKFCHVSVRTA